MIIRMTPMLVVAWLALAAGPAQASLCGLAHHLLRSQPQPGAGCCVSVYDLQCHTVMKTCTRTRYETITETLPKTVYDTVYDYQTVTGVDRIPETRYEEQPFTYQRPLIEMVTRQVPYTESYPVYETVSKNVHYVTYVPTYETKTDQVPFTTYHPVTETHTRTECFSVPRTVQYTYTVQVDAGHWETRTEEHPGPVRQKWVQGAGCWKWDPCCCRCVYVPGTCSLVEIQGPPVRICRRVWVPRIEQREVPATKVVYETRTRQVPYTYTRMVPETRTRPVTYSVCRMMPVTNSYPVHYQIQRTVTAQRTRTVTVPVTRMVPETGIRRVPVTTYREVPTTQTVCVARQVARTITCPITRTIPHTETYQVPVRVCVLVPKCTTCPAGDGNGCGPCCGRSCRKACSRGACGCACGSGCGNGCGNGCDAHSNDADGVSEPEADEVSPSDEADDVPGPPPADASVALTSLAGRGSESVSASQAFIHGLSHLWNREAEEAVERFQAAHEAEPTSARYAYFLALAQRRAGLDDAAERSLSVAVNLERQAPVDGWGRLMQRIQGADRLWLETARDQAGL